MARSKKEERELVDALVANIHHAVRLQNLREGLENAAAIYASKKRLPGVRVFDQRKGTLQALEAVAEFLADAGIERKLMTPLTEIACALQDADNGNQAAITDPKHNRHSDIERADQFPRRITKSSHEAIKMATALVALSILRSFRNLDTGTAADEVAKAAVGSSQPEMKSFRKRLVDWDKKLPRGSLSPMVNIYFGQWLRILADSLEKGGLSTGGVVDQALVAVRETDLSSL